MIDPFLFKSLPLPLMPKGRVPTEHEEQRAFVSIFRKSFKPVRIFAIPNGGKRGKAEAGRLKAEGVSAGVPDLFVPEWLLWIEFKRQTKGTVSKEQKEWHEYLTAIGHSVKICKGAEDAREIVLNFVQEMEV
tara:strand:+ start:405 stop:800 length:396 start_codon:yes stop_codon:yes gene_type:complete